ncbi:CBS-HotDog domain-containing transcription factor SpxR [Streptococcus oricebi]|uniref:CBS domain-containing protein n=1 Tax=Streptococcus oricebi TaxID=1547447 RepID=A0ABS5B2F7_9STRE|nr:CBS-HotDog domain-containing transcription factor SpxR [Streptococcus oricebi]MBP2623008.1 hypothetical protein [Streptococcus oricebi]
MSKHQEIIAYLENLPVGKRVSVRSVSNFLGVSDGTAYRAIKEAENRGLVETRPRSGTVRVKSKSVVLEHLTYQEIAEIANCQILAGQRGLDKEFSKFSIGAMTEQNIGRHLTEGGLLIVGDRTEIQLLALRNGNAVLITGGFEVAESVLSLADKKQIPVLRSKEDTYTVATLINRALANMQIKTDILTVEQVYRSSHEHGFLKDTDTVRDYLDLVRKSRFSRFPIINQHQMVVGVVTMRDAGDKSPYTTLDKVMTKSPFTTGLNTTIANISQRMIADDFEMIPVVRNNQTLLGVITRRDILDRMSREQVSSLPTFSDQIAQKISRKDKSFHFVVEPFMLDTSGVLSHGVLTEILSIQTQQLLGASGKSLMIEQMALYFLQAVQLDDSLEVQSRLVRRSRRMALLDFDIFLSKQVVARATITVKIN